MDEMEDHLLQVYLEVPLSALLSSKPTPTALIDRTIPVPSPALTSDDVIISSNTSTQAHFPTGTAGCASKLEKYQVTTRDVMLGWFVGTDIAEKVIRGDVLVEEHQVETRPERSAMNCLDENLSVHAIRKYFTFDAWRIVEENMKILKEKSGWLCANCHRDLSESDSLCCDSR
ncbi:hypothetical protein BSL78_08878 [Apostichopus japonicus]|uniref:Uncharacterized protein n=1 Tax=Stichopus japonicus TaxID=307972 RepID=A0A2G8L1W9_STIJA|nr:hypothetical protein BSL78_08878 [Apostichopus japonicus]